MSDLSYGQDKLFQILFKAQCLKCGKIAHADQMSGLISCVCGNVYRMGGAGHV